MSWRAQRRQLFYTSMSPFARRDAADLFSARKGGGGVSRSAIGTPFGIREEGPHMMQLAMHERPCSFCSLQDVYRFL